MPTHGNCLGTNCYAALVATRTLGLFYTETLVFEDDTDPEWEHLGQVLPIRQISYDHWIPEHGHSCLDAHNQVWIRLFSWYGDDWQMICDEDTCRTAATQQGYNLSNLDIKITWTEYKPYGRVYVAFRAGGIARGSGSGFYFIQSLDGGNTWYMTDSRLWGHDINVSGNCSFQFSYTSSELYGMGQVCFLALHSQFGDRAGFLYSKDSGNTWWPRDPKKNTPDPVWKSFVSHNQIPIPSRIYQNSMYWCEWAGLRSQWRVKLLEGWLKGNNTNKAPGYTRKIGWQNSTKTSVHLSQNAQIMLIGQPNKRILHWTNSLQAAIPVWNKHQSKRPVNASSGSGAGGQRLIWGFDTSTDIGGKYHTVRSTDDFFANVYNKSGENCNLTHSAHGDVALTSKAIPRDNGGVAKMGIRTWDVHDPIIDPEEPEYVWSGYPIWINAKGTELRADPTWDRLYVMAETVWPAGEGLWNQPIMFEFLLSGYWGVNYFENQGALGFMGTWAQGWKSTYSGSITYTGQLEAHVHAPTLTPAGGVVVVGDFGENDQVYYKENINDPPGLNGWVKVASFGAGIRATAVESDYEIEDDLSVPTDDEELYVPTDIGVEPWIWDNPKTVPFVVNTQMREGFDIWAGAEGTETNPVQYSRITDGAWGIRSNGLPKVQINRIKRSS